MQHSPGFEGFFFIIINYYNYFTTLVSDKNYILVLAAAAFAHVSPNPPIPRHGNCLTWTPPSIHRDAMVLCQYLGINSSLYQQEVSHDFKHMGKAGFEDRFNVLLSSVLSYGWYRSKHLHLENFLFFFFQVKQREVALFMKLPVSHGLICKESEPLNIARLSREPTSNRAVMKTLLCLNFTVSMRLQVFHNSYKQDSLCINVNHWNERK